MKIHTKLGLIEKELEGEAELRYDEVQKGYWVEVKLPGKEVTIFLPDNPINSKDEYYITIERMG